jgi:choline dehydrogenase-like flavoprotein
MLVDLKKAPRLTDVEYDVAIIGAGPAGLTIANRLVGKNVSVCLIEGGGRDLELRTQRLYRGDNTGHSYYRLAMCRYRLFGGSSNRWGGWLRPLDEIDFERRNWLPGSGWPISYHTVAEYHREAAEVLDAPSADFRLDEWAERMPPPLPLAGDFENAIIQLAPQTNFAEKYGKRVQNAPNVTVLFHANATELLLEPGTARVGSVAVSTVTGRKHQIRARALVVATGGIENARLLLNSRSDRHAGLGNEFDLVGRYFMEHLHVPAGHIAGIRHAAATDFYRIHAGGSAARGILTPSEDGLRSHHLPGCSIALEDPSYHTIGTPFLGWSPFVMVYPVNTYRILRRIHPGVGNRVKAWAERGWTAARHRQTLELERDARARSLMPGGPPLVSLYFRSEQVPNSASRVSLLDRRDELGVPLTRLDWRVTERDLATITDWLAILDRQLQSAQIGHVVSPGEGWAEGIIGGPHHIGTTRMSFSPRDGVVNSDCRLHSVENLYIAGSSLFTTGGHANPTFTIVALALRLAEHLQSVFGA